MSAKQELAALRAGMVADLAGAAVLQHIAGAAQDILTAGYAEASRIGRALAGDVSDTTDEDYVLAALTMAQQQPYLDRFMAQTLAGKYDTDAGRDTGAIAKRLALYVVPAVGVANQALTAASPAGTLWTWELGAVDEEHCMDCPVLADNSPYTMEQLPTYPGAGLTECMYSCKCLLVRGDGLVGFGTGGDD